MAYTCYAYLVLIDAKSTISLEALAERLIFAYRKDKRRINISQNAHQLSFYIERYQFEIKLNDSSAVSQESAELAINYLSHKKKQNKIVKCAQRLEISGDADVGMDYFNDSLRLLDEISKFKGIYIFDPQAGTFLDEL